MNIVSWHKDNDSRPFKIGDYVRITSSLNLDDCSDAAYEALRVWAPEDAQNMRYYQDVVTRITDVLKGGLYTIMADGCKYTWHRDLLKHAEKEDMQSNTKLVTGSKVRIVSSFDELVRNGSLTIDDISLGMPSYAGRVAVINRVTTWQRHSCDFELEIDDCVRWWPPAALEPISEYEWRRETKTKIAPGMRVHIKPDLIEGMPYDNVVATTTMVNEFAGKTAWVVKVDDANAFKVNIDGTGFWWSLGMVDIIEE